MKDIHKLVKAGRGGEGPEKEGIEMKKISMQEWNCCKILTHELSKLSRSQRFLHRFWLRYIFKLSSEKYIDKVFYISR